MKTAYIPLGRRWLVLFPEGGFLTKRRSISQKFAEKNNLPLLHNVTWPRMGALFVIRDTLLRRSDGLENDDTDTSSKDLLTIGDNNNLETHGNNNINSNNNNICKGDGAEDHTEVTADGQRSNGKLHNKDTEEEEKCSEEEEDKLEYILDVCIGYPDGVPLNLQNILFALREPCETVFYYRLYSTKDVSNRRLFNLRIRFN